MNEIFSKIAHFWAKNFKKTSKQAIKANFSFQTVSSLLQVLTELRIFSKENFTRKFQTDFSHFCRWQTYPCLKKWVISPSIELPLLNYRYWVGRSRTCIFCCSIRAELFRNISEEGFEPSTYRGDRNLPWQHIENFQHYGAIQKPSSGSKENFHRGTYENRTRFTW